MFIIIFLAVVRCLSVATPLWFRQTLGTKKLAVIFLAITASSIFITEFPIYIYIGIIPLHDKKQCNESFVLVFSNVALSDRCSLDFLGLFPHNSVQIVGLVSAIFRKFVLRRALKFRQQHLLLQETTASLDLNTNADNETRNLTRTRVKMCSHEIRITQQLFLLSIVCILSNTPKSILQPILLHYPELSLLGRYAKLFDIFDILTHAFKCIFCCSNFLIYLKYNSKFRVLFGK